MAAAAGASRGSFGRADRMRSAAALALTLLLAAVPAVYTQSQGSAPAGPTPFGVRVSFATRSGSDPLLLVAWDSSKVADIWNPVLIAENVSLVEWGVLPAAANPDTLSEPWTSVLDRRQEASWRATNYTFFENLAVLSRAEVDLSGVPPHAWICLRTGHDSIGWTRATCLRNRPRDDLPLDGSAAGYRDAAVVAAQVTGFLVTGRLDAASSTRNYFDLVAKNFSKQYQFSLVAGDMCKVRTKDDSLAGLGEADWMDLHHHFAEAFEAYNRTVQIYLAPAAADDRNSAYNYQVFQQARYFSFNQSIIHVVVLSTQDSLSVASPQYDWLVADLAAANASRATQPWIVVVGNVAPYASCKTVESGSMSLRAVLDPLFAEYSVDVAFWGDGLHYERSYPMSNGSRVYVGGTGTSQDPFDFSSPSNATIHIMASVGLQTHAKIGSECNVVSVPPWRAKLVAPIDALGIISVDTLAEAQLRIRFLSKSFNSVDDAFKTSDDFFLHKPSMLVTTGVAAVSFGASTTAAGEAIAALKSSPPSTAIGVGVIVGGVVGGLLAFTIVAALVIVFLQRRFSKVKEPQHKVDLEMPEKNQDTKRLLTNIVFGSRLGAHTFSGTYHGSKCALREAPFEKLDKTARRTVRAFSACNHPFVLRFLGLAARVDIEGIPDDCAAMYFLIVEWCSRGNLSQRFAQDSGDLDAQQMSSMVVDLASALEYASCEAELLPVLTLSSVYVDRSNVLKLDAFDGIPARSLFTGIESQSEYIQWCPPEVFSATDEPCDLEKVGVFMWARLAWSLYEHGRTPFNDLDSAQKIREAVDTGSIPYRPDRCPDDIYRVMTRCWDVDPALRPTFEQVRQYLENPDQLTAHSQSASDASGPSS